MSCDVPLDGAEAAFESEGAESVQTHNRIGDALPKQFVQICRVSAENSDLLFLAYKTVGLWVKVIGLESTELRPRDSGAPLQLGKIDPFQGKIVPLLGLHFLYGLCYNTFQAIAFAFFHVAPFAQCGQT